MATEKELATWRRYILKEMAVTQEQAAAVVRDLLDEVVDLKDQLEAK